MNMTSQSITSHTFRLFKRRQSFLSGMSQLFGFSKNQAENYNASRTDKEADLSALSSDWLAIGQDMQEAINAYESELNKPILEQSSTTK